MKKIYQFFGMLGAACLLFWGYPFIEVAVGAPVQAIDALGMTKSDGVSQVIAGDGVTYTYAITLTNTGITRVRGVVVTDTWPSAFIRGTVTTNRGSCSNTATGFTCNIGNMNAGVQVTISAPYTVPPGTPAGTYTNTALATATEGSLPVTVSDVNSVLTEADVLLVSKTDDPDPVSPGGILTYNLTVRNDGPSNASGVVLIDHLPAGTEYEGSPSTPACIGAGSTVTCPLGPLTSGSSRQVVIEVLVTSSMAATIHNTAEVTTTTTDPDMSNNVKDQNTTVLVDTVKPVVNWVEPVLLEQDYAVDCWPSCQPVQLVTDATDNIGVQKVKFFRWDHSILEYVDIGEDFTGPSYTWEFDTSVLPAGYNQIFAQAYDFAGQPSDRKRIFLIKYSMNFFPIIRKNSQ